MAWGEHEDSFTFFTFYCITVALGRKHQTMEVFLGSGTKAPLILVLDIMSSQLHAPTPLPLVPIWYPVQTDGIMCELLQRLQ